MNRLNQLLISTVIESSKDDINWGIDIAIFVAMLLGILAKAVWDSINASNEILVDPTRIVAAIIVSPIVYAGTYRSIAQDQGISLLTLALAFQSGFFWQAVFDNAANGANSANGTSPATS